MCVELMQGHIFDIWEEDASGCSQRVVVLVDDDEIFEDCDLFILIEYLRHVLWKYIVIFAYNRHILYALGVPVLTVNSW